MKQITQTLAASLAALISSASAQTTFNGGDLGTAGNWTNGLPTSALNPGTINLNGTVIANPQTTYTDYYITQTGGVISFSGVGNDPRLSGGNFQQNGGTWGVASGGRAFRLENSNVTTLTSGKIIGGSNGGTLINSSSLTVNGGSLETYGTNRGILLSGGSTLTINAGTVFTDTTGSATNTLGIGSLATGNNSINLNGGTTTVNFLGFGRNNSSSQLTLNIAGTTAGSFTAVDFVALSANELISERAIAWFSGSKMTFSLTNAASWAETEWDAGRMTYGGQNFSTLGNWSTVNGTIFNWNGGTKTLSLIPEPSSTALIGAGLVSLLSIRRRAQA